MTPDFRRRSFTRGCMAASLFVAALLAGAAQAGPAKTLRQITVVGEARTSVAPDLASISLGVRAENAEAIIAMREVSEKMTQVIAELGDAGIDKADMQTQRISIDPVWSKSGYDGQRKITGFVAANTLAVKVRDLSEVGEVLDAVLQAGANEFRNLSFLVDDTEVVADQLRASAVKDALRKAGQLAEAAGMQLGAVRSIQEAGGNNGGYPMMAMEMARSDALPVEAGSLEFEHSVTVVVDLLSPEQAPQD